MAGAIGNYIHLSAKNYEQYGVNQPNEYGTSSSSSVENAIAIEESLIKNRIDMYEQIDSKNIKSLELKINKLMKELGTGSNSTKGSGWGGQKARNFLQNILDEQFKNLQNISWSNASVELQDSSNRIGKIREDYLTYKDDWKKVLVTRVQQLNSALRDMEKGFNSSDGINPNEYSLVIDKVDKLLHETYEKTWEKISQLSGNPDKKATQNLIRALNEVIEEYVAYPNIELQKGTLFEGILQLIPQMGQKEINREIFDQAGKGMEHISVQTNEQFFDNNAITSQENKYGDVIRTVRSSQNKIDVSFTYNNTPLNISAKNVDFKGRDFGYISTLSGSSLDYLLQDENADFVNHYLNLFSNHTWKGSHGSASWEGNRRNVIKTMKLLLAYKGLTGDTYGRENHKVNVFIINEKSKGVKVISIAKILKNMIKDRDGTISVSKNIEQRYKNKRVEGDSWARISNVLMEMHNRKITTKINSSLLGKW